MYRIKLLHFDLQKTVKSEKGFLLIAALTLLTVLILLGTTAYILSSTDIKIGGNFRNTQVVLQVAMAGAEQAREALRVENLTDGGDPTTFSDELNSTTRKGPNGVLDGYGADDVPIASGVLNNVSYAAYLTNDLVDGLSNTTDSNGKVMLTSVATGSNGAKARVQIVVALFPMPSSPAVLYSKDNVTLNGSAISVSGTDSSTCGGGNLAPVYTEDPGTTTTNGNPVLTGSPNTPQHGSQSIDIQSYVNALGQVATTTLTSDVQNTTYGSPTNYTIVYADAIGTQADQELTLNNVTGYGILLVNGDLQLAGNITWNGPIFVTGTISASGGGSNLKNIQGQIFSGSSALGDSTLSGTVNVGYNSCNVKKASAGAPLKIINWKQIY